MNRNHKKTNQVGWQRYPFTSIFLNLFLIMQVKIIAYCNYVSAMQLNPAELVTRKMCKREKTFIFLYYAQCFARLLQITPWKNKTSYGN